MAMKRRLLFVCAALAALVTVGCASLDERQRSWIFQPSDRTWGGAAALALMVMSWILASHPERIGNIVLALSRVLPKRIAIRLAEIASAFRSGFAVARSPRGLFLSFVWSFPLWLAIAAEAWAVTVALGIEMPFTGAFLLQAMLVVGVAVPTPGGVGSYHEAYRLGVTSFFGAGNDQAVAAAILVHAISFVPVVLAGIIFMAQDGLSVGKLGELGASVDLLYPEDRARDVAEVRPEYDLYLLKSSTRLAMVYAGLLHQAGARIVNSSIMMPS